MNRLLDRRQAAAFLNEQGFPCTQKTLANLAWQGGGPLFTRYRNFKPLYRPDDLINWAVEQSTLCRSTSDPGVPLTRSDLGSPDSNDMQGEPEDPTKRHRKAPRDPGPGDDDGEGAVQ